MPVDAPVTTATAPSRTTLAPRGPGSSCSLMTSSHRVLERYPLGDAPALVRIKHRRPHPISPVACGRPHRRGAASADAAVGAAAGAGAGCDRVSVAFGGAV